MGAFKSLTGQDVIISPLVAYSDSITAGTVLKGKNVPYGSDNDETNPLPFPSASLIYASVKQLYYSNDLPNPEATFTSSLNVRRFDNFIQSGVSPPKSNLDIPFPTDNGDTISVVSIPKTAFSDYIKPGSVTCGGATDDGEGNMIRGGRIVGRVIYSHGIIIFTSGLGTTATFKSAKVIYETQYKCTIRPDEFNYSQNPTILNTSRPTSPISAGGESVDFGGVVRGFVTGSSFIPYATAVGLYDSNNICLAVGKLALPIPISRITDTNIIVSLDR